MKQLWMLSLALALLTHGALATIRYVNPNGSGQYLTILAAYNAASAGDTLLISPGAYNNDLIIQRKTALIGAGWDQVTTSRIILDQLATGCLLEGLHVVSNVNEPIYAENTADSTVIRRCYVRTNGAYPCFNRHLASVGRWVTFEGCILQALGSNSNANVIRSVKDSLVVRNCIMTQATATVSGQAALYGDPRFVILVNNTIVNVEQVFNTSGSYWLYAANNIVWDWNVGPAWGTYSPAGVFEYNASQGSVPPGTNGISFATDQFVAYNETNGYEHGISNLHLFNGSLLQNAGLPSINDRDGSRSDLGCYGGPYQHVDNGVPAFPFILSLTAPMVIMNGDSVDVTTLGRVGPRY